MKKLVAAICLALSIVAALGAGIVAARQGLHFVGKVTPPINVGPTYTPTVMGSLTPTDVLTKLKALNLKPTTIGGAAHFDVNHLYVNAGDYMEPIDCLVDPRPGYGIFVNSKGGVNVVHHAKANTIITVDFLVTNPVTNAPPTVQTSAGIATPQSWTITAPTHVVVVAVATAEGNYYFNLNGKVGVAELKGADVWDAAQ